VASVGAKAATGLEGEFKFTGFECSSGAPAKADLPGDGWDKKLSMSISLNSAQITSTMELFLKLSEEKGQGYIKTYQDAISQANQLPDSPQKQKYVDEANKAMESIKKFVAGSSCKETAVLNYSVSGNKIHTVPVSSSGTCDSTSSPQSDATFILAGDILKVTSQSESNECPPGDSSITVFKRVK
jgi:hypothetical protein